MERILQRSRTNWISKNRFSRGKFLALLAILTINTVVFLNYGAIVTTAQDNQGNQQAITMPPKLDGVITPGEYAVANNISDLMQVYVSIIGPVIYFGMVGKTTGWVSIGIEPESGMQGADIILGWVSGNNESFIVDSYGDSGTTHAEDTTLGGTFDIIAWSGTEAGGYTTIEFVRLLNTTDQYDKAIPEDADTLDIMWGIGPDTGGDNEEEYHAERGYHTLSLKSGVVVSQPQQETSQVNGGSFLLFHSVVGFLIGIGLYALVYFPTVAIFVKRELQEIVIKRKLREYPRVVEKPRVIDSDSSTGSSSRRQ